MPAADKHDCIDYMLLYRALCQKTRKSENARVEKGGGDKEGESTSGVRAPLKLSCFSSPWVFSLFPPGTLLVSQTQVQLLGLMKSSILVTRRAYSQLLENHTHRGPTLSVVDFCPPTAVVFTAGIFCGKPARTQRTTRISPVYSQKRLFCIASVKCGVRL